MNARRALHRIRRAVLGSPVHTPPQRHRRRRTDVWWINARENWYRDVWLLIITVAIGWLALSADDQSGKARTYGSEARAAALAAHEISIENRQLPLQTRRLALQFQQERLTNIRDSCLAQNAKHATLVKRVNEAIAKILKQHPGQYTRQQVEQSRAQTIFLLSVADPLQNCKQVVLKAQRVTKPPPKALIPPPTIAKKYRHLP